MPGADVPQLGHPARAERGVKSHSYISPAVASHVPRWPMQERARICRHTDLLWEQPEPERIWASIAYPRPAENKQTNKPGEFGAKRGMWDTNGKEQSQDKVPEED